MKKEICDVIDLISLINAHVELEEFIDYIKMADIVLLLSVSRVNEKTFETYKRLLESLSTVLLPYFISSAVEFNNNLFSTDMSKMKIEQLDILSSKRLAMYEDTLVNKAKEILKEAVAL